MKSVVYPPLRPLTPTKLARGTSTSRESPKEAVHLLEYKRALHTREMTFESSIDCRHVRSNGENGEAFPKEGKRTSGRGRAGRRGHSIFTKKIKENVSKFGA